MYLHKYKDYEDYKSKQITANKKKITLSWVDPYVLHIVANYVISRNPEVSFGLCHGTRRGVEQMQLIEDFRFFGKEVEVLGTEISDTATQFPNTIEWDFHEVKDEWVNNVDFIYSNSLDHSYDPPKCLDAWMSCLSELGVCVLEWSSQHGKLGEDTEKADQCGGILTKREIDPFVASLDEYKNIIEKKYNILDIIENEQKPRALTGWALDKAGRKSTFIFIGNREK